MFDLTAKARLHARASTPDFWVLDIPGRPLTVHRGPEADQHLAVTVYQEQETVSPLATPASTLALASVLPE